MSSKIAQNYIFENLLADDKSLFKNFSKMSVEDFNYPLHKISPKIGKSDTNYCDAIPPKMRLVVTCASQQLETATRLSCMYLFITSESTISKTVPEVCIKCINSTSTTYKYYYYYHDDNNIEIILEYALRELENKTKLITEK